MLWRHRKCNHCGADSKKYWSLIAIDADTGMTHVGIKANKEYQDKLLIHKAEEIIMPNEFDEKIKEVINLSSSYNSWMSSIAKDSKLFWIETCDICKDFNIVDYETEQVLYPMYSDIEAPNKDMPQKIKKLYEEASSIYKNSKRAALALLRLALDLLCEEKGYNKGNLYDKIENLARDGVFEDDIKEIAHGVRGLGNGAVHPREIDEEATEEEVKIVFELLNLITEELITKPLRKKAFADRFKK